MAIKLNKRREDMADGQCSLQAVLNREVCHTMALPFMLKQKVS
jgi:hypothetical protein